jgi:hypothetical protein
LIIKSKALSEMFLTTGPMTSGVVVAANREKDPVLHSTMLYTD